MAAEKYSPIDGLATPKVRVDIPLPLHIDQQEIGIHLGRVRTLCRLGGIAHLKITGHTGDETSNAVPTMVGFNNQGGGYAGMLGTKIDVPTHRTTRSHLENVLGVPHSARWVDGVISANLDEIAQRIGQDQTQDPRSPQTWASHLDKVVRTGIKDIGTNHLMLGLNKRDIALTPTVYGIYFASGLAIQALTKAMVSALGRDSSHLKIEAAGWDLFYAGWFMNIVNFALYHPRNNPGREEGSRLSLIYGPQLDRAGVLQVLSHRKNIVKSLEVNHDQ